MQLFGLQSQLPGACAGPGAARTLHRSGLQRVHRRHRHRVRHLLRLVFSGGESLSQRVFVHR